VEFSPPYLKSKNHFPKKQQKKVTVGSLDKQERGDSAKTQNPKNRSEEKGGRRESFLRKPRTQRTGVGREETGASLFCENPEPKEQERGERSEPLLRKPRTQRTGVRGKEAGASLCCENPESRTQNPI
jgi:hypothetical protein